MQNREEQLSDRGMGWRFALCLVLLFCIMTLAPNAMLEYLRYSAQIDPAALRVVHITVFFLTAGFLLMVGGFGIWVYRTMMEMESRRRVSRMVEAMDFLTDGLVALDRAGKVTGLNPAARRLAGPAAISGRPLESLFPGLRPSDLAELLGDTGAFEVERAGHGGILRFRAHRGEDFVLVQIGDVTESRHEQHEMQRQAQYQMIGRLARGVAHDFNNVLCAISGYAELLKRPSGNPAQDQESVRVIEREAQRGAALARRLMELSRETPSTLPSGPARVELQQACDLLGVALDKHWDLELEAPEDLPAVDYTGSRLQQMVVNLGLLASGSLQQPGRLRLVVSSKDVATDRDGIVHGSLLLSILPDRGQTVPPALWETDRRSSVEREGIGVIHSVVRTMMEEAGGRLEVLRGPEGMLGFRCLLPVRPTRPPVRGADGTSGHAARRFLLAAPTSKTLVRLRKICQDIGAEVREADGMSAFLELVEQGGTFSGILVAHSLLGPEAGAVFRVVRKLQPKTGMVLLADMEGEPLPLERGVIPVAPEAAPGELLQVLEQAEKQIAGVVV